MANLEQIDNYRRISSALGTGGQPTADQFVAVRDAGYEVVINLAMSDSEHALASEADLIAELGITYVHIPVVWTAPTLDDLAQFFQAMDRYQDRRVFVHCIKNYRVSAFVLLYRVVRLNVPLEMARASMLDVWVPNPVWRRFIDDALDKYGVQA